MFVCVCVHLNALRDIDFAPNLAASSIAMLNFPSL